MSADAAEVAVELLAGLLCSGLGTGEADAEDGVGAEAGFVLGAVDFDHLVVDGFLLADEHALELFVEDGVDVVDGVEHAFAEELALVAVAELAGFVDAGGGATRHGGATHGALVGIDVDFYCGIAATVENLTALDSYNLTHSSLFVNVLLLLMIIYTRVQIYEIIWNWRVKVYSLRFTV